MVVRHESAMDISLPWAKQNRGEGSETVVDVKKKGTKKSNKMTV